MKTNRSCDAGILERLLRILGRSPGRRSIERMEKAETRRRLATARAHALDYQALGWS